MSIFDNSKPTGSLRISKEVIATIADAAAREIPGVADLVNSTDITGWVLKRQTARPVAISLVDDMAVIDVSVILKNSSKLQEVSEKIQANIKETVQSMTGITVSKVNVYIAGVDFAAPAKPQEA